ncbi:hypothetical protein IW261DRAFT_1560658 [Armillaria novae-zelandiae]|uniref:ABC transmembrane type-1 domain-containing protein n=1 Tax=Armillaria novae-zelandiae TaxID=153914 RepID=A0AA39UD99_9AGAR|nr:hypothetical protein IW261DRAFT_1560658 [Armillaria novae-zelandiae]
MLAAMEPLGAGKSIFLSLILTGFTNLSQAIMNSSESRTNLIVMQYPEPSLSFDRFLHTATATSSHFFMIPVVFFSFSLGPTLCQYYESNRKQQRECVPKNQHFRDSACIDVWSTKFRKEFLQSREDMSSELSRDLRHGIFGYFRNWLTNVT